MSTQPPPRVRPIVSTKLRPPSNRATLIERPRLIDVLSHALERTLALVHAPAGFGKTTLAAQWYDQIRSDGIAAGWLAIDASDNDLERFLAYVVDAIRSVEPEIGSGLTQVIESNPGNVAEFVIGDLINEFELYDKEFVLFLDDWHLIRNPEIHKVLDQFLSRIPPNLHLVIASRTREGLPLGRLRVQNELVEINVADLRLNYHEASNFLADAKQLELAEDDRMSLWRCTEGWIAALQLASISLRRTPDRECILQWVSGAPADIGEYLAESVLSSLPSDLVEFMMKTSILERLSGDLCRAVTGEAASSHFLDLLERQELFLLPLDDDRQWFRYHHLFAKFLQRRLDREFPSALPALHLAASDWLSANKLTAEALTHAIAAGKISHAIDLVERDAMSLVQHSFMGSLLSLVARLPREKLFDRGILQTAIAWANCLTHHPHEAEQALTHVEAVALSKDPQTQKLLLGEANVVRACVGVYADELDDAATMVLPCLDDSENYSPWVIGVAANILTYVYIHTYQFEKVAPLQAWARRFQDSAEGLFSGVYGRSFSGIAATCIGDLALGKKYFCEALVLARNTAGKQSHAARLAGALLGQLQYEMNEIDEAEQLLQESRILGFEGGVVDFYIATYLPMSRLMVLRGDCVEAFAILREGIEAAKQLRLDRLAMAIATEEVRLNLLTGDIRAAQRILADCDSRCTATEPGIGIRAQMWDSLQIARARLWIVEGRPKQAMDLLRAQAERAHALGRKYHELTANILLAIGLDVAGRELDAEILLLRIVNENIPLGFVRSFLDEGPRIVSILERIREKARRSQTSGVLSADFSLSAHTLIANFRRSGRKAVAVPSIPDTEQRRTLAPRHAMDDVLKGREIDILRFLDQGRSNKEIARALGISVDTVKWYLKAIFSKLGVARRGQAIAEARRLRLMDNP